MTEAGAQKAVVTSILVVGGTMIYDDVKAGGRKQPVRQLIALTVLAAALAAGASVAPDIAGPLAILIAVGYLVAHLGKG